MKPRSSSLNMLQGLGVLFFIVISWPNSVSANTEELLAMAQSQKRERYDSALAKGAEIIPSQDGKSFSVLWIPPSEDPKKLPPIIVTLHGHAGWAFDGFSVWYPEAQKRGFGILAIQWWFGGGERIEDYYTPLQMYPVIESILRKIGAQPGKVLLHGFSRGSANVYALAGVDRQSGNNYFGTIIANSGGFNENYPPNRELVQNSKQPLAGTRWIYYCGGNDPNPDRDGCPGMRRTSQRIQELGGKESLFIEDASGNHGGFHLNPSNASKAVDVFLNNIEAS